MTYTTLVISVLVFSLAMLLLLLVLGWREAERQKMLREAQGQRQNSGWMQLPSGWVKGHDGLEAFILPDQRHFYWFVNRGGRTIIEGPAATLAIAQNEVDAALSELRRN